MWQVKIRVQREPGKHGLFNRKKWSGFIAAGADHARTGGREQDYAIVVTGKAVPARIMNKYRARQQALPASAIGIPSSSRAR